MPGSSYLAGVCPEGRCYKSAHLVTYALQIVWVTPFIPRTETGISSAPENIRVTRIACIQILGMFSLFFKPPSGCPSSFIHVSIPTTIMNHCMIPKLLFRSRSPQIDVVCRHSVFV